MILELLIFLERLTEKDIGEFYSRYCKAYDLGNDEKGCERVQRNALKELYSKGFFEYHPIKDCLFKIKVNDRKIQIQTSSQRRASEKSQEDAYLALLKKYFLEKEDAVSVKQVK